MCERLRVEYGEKRSGGNRTLTALGLVCLLNEKLWSAHGLEYLWKTESMSTPKGDRKPKEATRCAWNVHVLIYVYHMLMWYCLISAGLRVVPLPSCLVDMDTAMLKDITPHWERIVSKASDFFPPFNVSTVWTSSWIIELLEIYSAFRD